MKRTKFFTLKIYRIISKTLQMSFIIIESISNFHFCTLFSLLTILKQLLVCFGTGNT